MNSLSVSVWRGRESGHYQQFDVPRLESQTVLDVVTYIQRALDPTLAEAHVALGWARMTLKFFESYHTGQKEAKLLGCFRVIETNRLATASSIR